MAEVNAAARANLERVLSEEQRRAVLRMAWLRLALVSVAGVIIFFAPTPNPEAVRPTRIGVVALIITAGLVLALSRALPRHLVRWLALSVPLLDVPLLSYIQHVQGPFLPALWMGIPTKVSMMCAFLVLSALSLSRTVVWVTVVTVVISIVHALLRVPGLSPIPLALTALMPVGMGAVLTAVISRIRSLLHEARARDLVGKYVLGERLGVGGMAEVFLATYSPEGGFERRVAVKRILPSFLENAESVALFRREAELGALLAHPNIVQVLDFGSDGSSYFLAMEYVDGLSLSRLLSWCAQAGVPLPMEACVTVAWSLGEATDYLHTRTSATGTALNLVHRDLNPPNVMISRLGEVKLGDFGIARGSEHEQLTRDGVMRGKVGYSAPEQLAGEPFDGRADLFSLGVTLHETLLARRLFVADTDLGVVKALMEAKVPAPSSLRPDVPPALDEAVLQLLQRELPERTPSARDFVNAVTALGAPVFDLAKGKRQLADLVARAMRERQATPMDVRERAADPDAPTQVNERAQQRN